MNINLLICLSLLPFTNFFGKFCHSICYLKKYIFDQSFPVQATNCFTSLDTDHKWNTNGTSVPCRVQAGVTTRYCLYFKTGLNPKYYLSISYEKVDGVTILDGRPGKIFRDCDYVYENLFGFNNFNLKIGTGEWTSLLKYKEEISLSSLKLLGCRLFSGSTLDGGAEKGMYCYCLGNNCNSGDIAYPVTVGTNTTTPAPGG